MADDRFELDAETRRLLWALAVVAHQTPAEYVAAMIAAEYDRQFPGKREYAKLPAEERRARLFAALGQQPPAPPTAEQRRQWDAADAEVEQQAQEIYGERSGRNAA